MSQSMTSRPNESPSSELAERLAALLAAGDHAAIHDLFGEGIKVEVSFPPLQRRQGLRSLGASNTLMTSGALEQFDRAAREVALQVVDDLHRPMLVSCTKTRNVVPGPSGRKTPGSTAGSSPPS